VAAPDADRSPEFFQKLSQPTGSVILVVDGDLKISWVSESAEWILGFPAAALVGADGLDFLHPDDLPFVLGVLAEVEERDPTQIRVIARPSPVRVRTATGHQWFEIGAEHRADDPHVAGTVVRLRPEPTQVLVDRFLGLSMLDLPVGDIVLPLLELLEHEVPGSLTMLAHDWDGERFGAVVPTRPTSLTAAVHAASGEAPWVGALGGQGAVRVSATDVEAPLAAAMDAAGVASLWVDPTTPSGEQGACILTWRVNDGLPWRGHDDSLARVCRMAALVIERIADERALRRAATRDPLTGLWNRAAFYDALGARDGHDVAVLFLDLDGFKPVNDRHGHDVGDAVLREVAQRLSGAVRVDDLTARLGGDEFAVLLVPPCGRAEVERIADRLCAVVSAPIRTTAGDVTVGVSIGAASRGVEGDGAVDELVTIADRAMYEAKRAGGSAWRVA